MTQPTLNPPIPKPEPWPTCPTHGTDLVMLLGRLTVSYECPHSSCRYLKLEYRG